MDINTSVEMLYPLFVKMWEKNEVPTEWKKDPTETLEMEWSYSLCKPVDSTTRHRVCSENFKCAIEIFVLTSLNLEYRWEKGGKRTAEYHVAPRSGSKRQRNWIG